MKAGEGARELIMRLFRESFGHDEQHSRKRVGDAEFFQLNLLER